MKTARKTKKYSQEKLAELANLSSQMVNDIEGCRRWPSDKTLIKIANALDIDVYILFSPSESEKNCIENRISKKEIKNRVIAEIKTVITQVLDNMTE